MTALFETEGLTKRYRGADVLADVSLAVGAGRRVALVGHNGAGKTTLIKLLLGLIRPSSGDVRVLGGAPNAAHRRGLDLFRVEGASMKLCTLDGALQLCGPRALRSVAHPQEHAAGV